MSIEDNFETVLTTSINDLREIRYHNTYYNLSEYDSSVKRVLWNAFMKQIAEFLDSKNLFIIRFIGYRQEGDHDMVLEYTLKAYK